ncbi:restriction endonuclease subunit S [Arenibacter sp. N53]|uniref:restriction endonuclease subunit S n=1 Tax=Arenibacter TaxID=178469 RepID=UPI000CD407B8|nr:MULTISPECIES: restriction endonuclease subunit S [Arenibacter]MCM4153539.1 restriction endonuclease subunit S [Arenibacter sp. N53]
MNIPYNWNNYKLSDIAHVQTGPFGSQLHQEDYIDGGTPLVTVKNLGARRISRNNLDGVSDDDKKRLSRYIMRRGDIIFSRVGANIDRTSLVTEDEDGWIFSSSTLRARLHDESVSSTFLIYLFHTPNFKNLMRTIAVGATRPSLNSQILKDISITLPPLPEQKAIAPILSTLDDKIENNLAMNKTLEDMAMALYKHWFVDFGPFKDGEFVDSELGLIPKGWEVKKLVNFVNLTMGQSPKSEFYNDSNAGLPFHQGVSDYGLRFPEDKKYSTFGNRLALKGDILFSVRAPVGRINIAKNKIILGRGLASMRMDGNSNFLFYALKNMFSSEDMIGSGTVFNSVNKTELQNLKFIIPSKSILEKFSDVIQPMDFLYYTNSNNNQTLTQLRDTLLPKLISGEVRLNEFKETLANVL